VKRETLEQMGRTGLSPDDVKAHKRRIKQIQRHVVRLEEALAVVETNRILERLTEREYPLIRANITAEKIATETELDRLQEELNGVARDKHWVNWMGDFQKRLREQKTMSPEQRRAFLEGMLTNIDVTLVAPGTHSLQINFDLPIVNDQLEYINPQEKQKGYRLVEGERSLTTRLDVRAFGKKKQC